MCTISIDKLIDYIDSTLAETRGGNNSIFSRLNRLI